MIAAGVQTSGEGGLGYRMTPVHTLKYQVMKRKTVAGSISEGDVQLIKKREERATAITILETRNSWGKVKEDGKGKKKGKGKWGREHFKANKVKREAGTR